MLNKKGTSLAEVIISIVLISVVLIFMMKLLIDLNNKETNNNYAKGNQINRVEILRRINNDLNNKTLTTIEDISSSDTLSFNLKFSDGTIGKVVCKSNYLEYTGANGETRKWSITDGTINIKKANVYYRDDASKPSSQPRFFTLSIVIEIYTLNENNQEGNNNILDDISLSYLGNMSDLVNFNTKTCLGNGC